MRAEDIKNIDEIKLLTQKELLKLADDTIATETVDTYSKKVVDDILSVIFSKK